MSPSLSKILSIPDSLQHAYILVGDQTKIVTELKVFLEQHFGDGFISANNPDFNFKNFASWGVDESRELKSFHSCRSIVWPAKVTIIVSEVITAEAQNSLLKTLEEPFPGNHFFIIIKNLKECLPTVVSRCQVIQLENENFSEELVVLAKDFLAGNISRRFEINKIILKNQEDNISSGLNWLNCLLDLYWGKVSYSIDKKVVSGAEALSKAISYASARGSSLRIILDHIALVLPN